jgi:hypothetical protein
VNSVILLPTWLVVRRLAKRAERAFGRPLPARMLERKDLYRVAPRWGSGLLVGDKQARACPFLTASDLDKFHAAAGAGYCLVGFWGRGVNSHAFHYAAAEPAGSIWLRLPFGGIYMDNEDAGAAIPDFLHALFAFIDAAKAKQLSYTVMHGFTGGEIRLDDAAGHSWRAEGNFLYYPNFRHHFSEALADPAG